MNNSEKICPYCKGGGFIMGKAKMVVEILKIAGVKTEKSIYGDGSFTKEELFSVYSWMKEREIEGRKASK